MKLASTFGLIVVFGSMLQAQAVNVRGKITDGTGKPVANAVVELERQGTKDTTGADGAFSLIRPDVPIRPLSVAFPGNIRLDRGVLEFVVSEPGPLKVEIFDVNGDLRKNKSIPKALPGIYHFDVAASPRSNGLIWIRASNGRLERTFKYLPLPKGASAGGFSLVSAAGGRMAKTEAVLDTLRVSANGFAAKEIPISSYDTTVNVTLEADTGTLGGIPHVTPQNATSVPAGYGNAIANPGKWASKTYPAYYYKTDGSVDDMFKPPVKQNAPIQKPVLIYTPPGYDPQIQYPYIVVMHGYQSYEYRWYDLSNPNLVNLFDNLIASKATKPFIAVFPRGSQDVNNANGFYNFGGEMMNDLIPFLEANYSLRKDRGSRAMAGFSFGGMQTLSIGLCAHLKDFAWFAGLDPAGPGVPSSDAITQHVATENPQTYPIYYLYISVGTQDGTAGGSAASAAKNLATKSPYITSSNFSFQNNIPGGHTYPVAEVGLYNFLRMAFAAN